MKIYVFTKTDEFGGELYQRPDGSYTRNIDEAREYKGQFWLELLKILIQLISIFGVGKLKLKK